jgi:F0F1-type ATP synthase assembly protein I
MKYLIALLVIGVLAGMLLLRRRRSARRRKTSSLADRSRA